jgi:hypothetical protein
MRRSVLNLNGQNKPVVYPDSFAELPSLGEALGITVPRPVVTITGGAGGMSDAEIEKTQAFFEQYLVPFVQEKNALVIEGGTDSGVIRAISRAIHNHEVDLPLIGVAGRDIENIQASLETNQTHFILCPGSDWGDEVEWIAASASALAGSASSVNLLFNGGQIAWEDAACSIKYKRPVLIAEGSGRTADVIARTNRWKALDFRAIQLLRTGMVHIANPFKEPEKYMEKLRTLLTAKIANLKSKI